MTTTTNESNTTTSSDLIGAERMDTPAKAKGAAKPRTTRPAKPAAKDAAKPAGKDAAKPAGKAGDKKAPAKKATPSGKGALYFISANRPASGALLHAHTEAFFRIYGMHKAGGAPLSTARVVLGATAINYHVGAQRFEKRDGKLYMTEAGKIQFGGRLGGIDENAVKAFMSVMTSGKPDGTFVKAAGAIGKVA